MLKALSAKEWCLIWSGVVAAIAIRVLSRLVQAVPIGGAETFSLLAVIAFSLFQLKRVVERGRSWARFTRDLKEPHNITVVIPALNEESRIEQTVGALVAKSGIKEVLVVDGGSVDQTVTKAKGAGARLIVSKKGRGAQMRKGAEEAVGDVVVFMHADTTFLKGGADEILEMLKDKAFVGGACWKRFAEKHWAFLGGEYRCGQRMLLSAFAFGDQTIFVRRDVLERGGGFPDAPLMEEFELFKRLRACGRVGLADVVVETSARKFLEFGIIRSYLLMGGVRCLYRIGTPLRELESIYRQGFSYFHSPRRAVRRLLGRQRNE